MQLQQFPCLERFSAEIATGGAQGAGGLDAVALWEVGQRSMRKMAGCACHCCQLPCVEVDVVCSNSLQSRDKLAVHYRK